MGFLTLPQRNQTVDRSHPLLRDDGPAFTCRGRAGRRGGFGAVGLDGAVVAWGAAGHLQWNFQKRAVGPVHNQVGSDVETVTAEKYADAQMAGSARTGQGRAAGVGKTERLCRGRRGGSRHAAKEPCGNSLRDTLLCLSLGPDEPSLSAGHGGERQWSKRSGCFCASKYKQVDGVNVPCKGRKGNLREARENHGLPRKYFCLILNFEEKHT